jgi:hypothetical protein
MSQPPTHDWIDILQALLTPTLAFFGLLIAVLQWRINAQRIKHERFPQRFAIVESLRHFMQSIIKNGRVIEKDRLRFLSETAGSRFIFDKDISQYLTKVHDSAVDLETSRQELSAAPQEEKKALIQQQSKVKHWVIAQLRSLEDTFSKYF